MFVVVGASSSECGLLLLFLIINVNIIIIYYYLSITSIVIYSIGTANAVELGQQMRTGTGRTF